MLKGEKIFRHLCSCSIFLFLFNIITLNLSGQTSGISSTIILTPTAREAINKGITAAKVSDYLLAIRYFEEARKIAPQSPEIFYNLGLAESKIPGRELRAISWLGAYLSANANAPNAAAVKDLITELNKKNKINTLGMLDMLEDVLKQSSTWENIGMAAELRIKVGDITGAKKIINGYDVNGGSGGPEIKYGVELKIIQSQITAGDTSGALATLRSAVKIANLFYGKEKISALLILASLQMKLRDSAIARNTFIKTINLVDSIWGKAEWRVTQAVFLTDIANVQFKAGDISGGKNTLKTALNIVELLENKDPKNNLRSDIALVYIEQGDIEQAEKIIEKIGTSIYLPTYYKRHVQEAIVEYKKMKGDLAGALKTAGLIETDYKSRIQTGIAELQMNTGDTTGAKTTLSVARESAESITTYNKSKAFTLIAIVQAKMGDVHGAESTIKYAVKLAKKIPKGDVVPEDHSSITRYYGLDGWEDKRAALQDIDNAKKTLDGMVNANQTPVAIQSKQTPVLVNTQILAWLSPFEIYHELADAPFVDLAVYLKSINDGNPENFLKSLLKTSKKIVEAEVKIEQMLKEQELIKK